MHAREAWQGHPLPRARVPKRREEDAWEGAW